MDKLSKFVALIILSISLIFSVEQFYMGLNEVESPDRLYTIWTILFAVLIALWSDKDRVGRDWPFEYGFFVYLFWPVVLPYYLFKTRGVDGLVMFFGFSTLYVAPNVMWLIGYQYS